MKKEMIPWVVGGILLIITFVSVGSGVYFYRQYRESEEQLKNPTDAAKKEIQQLLAKVRKLMVLPNEEATVATVADVETLQKTQPFFQDAADGDKVLIFQAAKKAVIYRPSTNVIINVAPLVIGDGQGNPASPSSQLLSGSSQGQILKIALRNGTGVTGITKKLEEELKTKMQNITIVEKDNAERQDYEKTVVIALSDTLSKNFVQQLANELSASVSALPFDEPKPAADLLIIAGKDRR